MAARPPIRADVADNLALAMLTSSEAPLLLLDGDLTVMAASASFCRSFGFAPDAVSARSIFDLGVGEWNAPRLRSLLNVTSSGMGAVEAYEMDLRRPRQDVRRLLINARKLEFGDNANTRLLVTISDVTEARKAERVKDDLLREKAVLLKEIQHRVANSLQIIASVLLQSARKVQSDETRSHLHDAHHRVLSIATVQKQLAMSGEDDVELGPYFSQLCESLGASMIRDHTQLSIAVSTDRSLVRADISVSLGLIVTELVINALKHAFPDERHGKIMVGYVSRGPNWTLSVTDDGVGLPAKPADAKPGLGTSIVEALSNQLRARITVTDAKPGTAVSIQHTQLATVDDEARAAV